MSETELEVGSTEDVEGIKLTDRHVLESVTHTHSAVLQSPIPCLAIAAGDPCSLHPSFLFNVHILIHTTHIIFHQTKQ